MCKDFRAYAASSTLHTHSLSLSLYLSLSHAHTYTHIDVLQSFSRVNVQGFSRICGKIDRKMSPGLSKLILSNYVHNMGYCKDFAEDGNGTHMCVYEYAYVYVRAYTPHCAYICVYTYICIYTYDSFFRITCTPWATARTLPRMEMVHVCVYICMCIYVCTHIHINLFIYVCTLI